MPGLDFKYWGVKSLNKVVGAVGKFLKEDQITKNRENLSFARLLVEVTVDQDFSGILQFKNEKGAVVEQKVYYPWKPITCMQCHGYGHSKKDCIKKKQEIQQRKVWVVKQTKIGYGEGSKGNGFQETVGLAKGNGQHMGVGQNNDMATTEVQNRYEILNDATTEEMFYDVNHGDVGEVQGLKAPEGHG